MEEEILPALRQAKGVTTVVKVLLQGTSPSRPCIRGNEGTQDSV